MNVALLITLSLFGHVINSDIENVIDLVIKHKSKIIRAYPSINNNEILKGKDTSRFGELVWHSIGSPTLLNFHSKKSSFSILDVFIITHNGFFLQIELLTETQRELLKEAVKSKYGIDVKTSQIHDLIPSKLKCKTEVTCSNGTILKLYGEALDLEHNPLNVQFVAPMGFEKIECFEHQLIENNLLNVKCVIRINLKDVDNVNIYMHALGYSPFIA